MTRIYIIRHAEAEGNLYRRMQGQYDSRVTVMGRRQLEALAKRFTDVELHAVYCSGLSRTRLTAMALSEPKGLLLRVDPRFLEIDLGPWEDKPFGQVELYEASSLHLFSHCPEQWHKEGAEDHAAFTGRYLEGLREAARRHAGQTIAIVTHGGVTRAVLRRLFPDNDGGHLDNTAVTLLEYENGKFLPVYQNDNAHLNDETSTLACQKWWKGQTGLQDVNLWFRPLQPLDSEIYIDFRRDAWRLIYGNMKGFDGHGFLSDAKRTGCGEENALVFVMQGMEIAGVLQLNMQRGQEHKAGYIPFFYLKSEYRDRGLGVQLIGHAVSVFRPLGRTSLQLSVAPTNERAIHFYEKYGFRIIRQGKNRKPFSLHLMELDITVD